MSNNNNNNQPQLAGVLQQQQHLAGVYLANGVFQYTCCMGCRHSNGTRPFYHCWRYVDELDDDDTDDEDDDFYDDFEYEDHRVVG